MSTLTNLFARVHRQWLAVWLRCQIQWADADVRQCKDSIELAEAEAAFLPRQLDAYKQAAAELRARLVTLGAQPFQRNIPKPRPWPDAPPPRRGHP